MATPTLNLTALVSRIAGDIPGELKTAAAFADRYGLTPDAMKTLAPIAAMLLTTQAGGAVTDPATFERAVVDLLDAAAEIVSVVQR